MTPRSECRNGSSPNRLSILIVLKQIADRTRANTLMIKMLAMGAIIAQNDIRILILKIVD
jgi:hypothetical protein